MKFQSAELTRDQNGLLVFQTKAFGPVPSFNQYLSPGSYEIIIKASDSYPIRLIAEAKPILPPNLFNPVNTSSLNFYEISQSQLMKNQNFTQSGFKNLPVPSLDSNIPRPTSTMDSYYDYISLPPNTIPSFLPSDKNATNKGYEELQNCTSSKPETQEETLSELIAKLPTLDLNESKQPIPRPRKVFSSSNQTDAVQQQKPVMSVKPTKKVAFQLADSENEEIPETGKKMKAFVHSYQDKFEKRLHFIWVCDVMETSIFVSPNHRLEIGHFFEGIFQKQPSGKLECIEYKNPIPAMLRGSIVYGKIELKAKITNYQSSETLKYPQVYVEHLGSVVSSLDNKFNKLR
ncbi:hypothetical protein CRE_16904 [Caenorhabditis remanei]|uniref:Uncharacterized protein n=1 Tax=Caenorhabditis remanei TaxID=31234 RepID=E3MSB2_CAERE|nr:hypothetical protein CRE_16904 [Caenorhabditis remanei]